MNVPTEHQVITKDGRPEFVVIPYADYVERFGEMVGEESTLPHEVVGFHVVEGMSLIKAWRKYKKLTQAEMAERVGVSQPAYSQMEKAERPQQGTLEKAAAALGVSVEQLRD